ncbi:MAG: hypothetical protein SFZ02_00665 [bacterium]|nr:hypothetical protein [bacterium]
MSNLRILRLDEPIIPAKSLGGINLGEKIIQADLQEMIKHQSLLKPEIYTLVSPFQVRYTLENSSIYVSVDVRNGKIFHLVALEGYTGKLFDKITVGMKIGDAMKLVPDLYYDEAQEQVLCKDILGIAIDPPEVDPPPDLVPDMVISAINIFVPQIATLRGHQGFWDVMLEEDGKS